MITIHAGHNPDGEIAHGAVGLMRESTAAREISKALGDILKANAIDYNDITVNNGLNQRDVLRRLAERNNAAKPDLAISIHLNAYNSGDANGVEAYCTSGLDVYAQKYLLDMHERGYKNRGIKNAELFILNNFNCPTILFECGFVTNANDCKMFNAELHARAIYRAICSFISHRPVVNIKSYYIVKSQPLSYTDADALARRLAEQAIYTEIIKEG